MRLHTVLDRIRQARILFTAKRSEALKRFLVAEGALRAVSVGQRGETVGGWGVGAEEGAGVVVDGGTHEIEAWAT